MLVKELLIKGVVIFFNEQCSYRVVDIFVTVRFCSGYTDYTC